MVAHHLGLAGQVVGIDPDAMSAHQSGLELEEVPFGAGGFEDVAGVDVELVENDGQLVHQGDVQIALGVFDDLGRLGGLDGAGAVDAGLDNPLIEGGHALEGFRAITGHDLDDLGQGALFVAGVDALGAVADEKVLPPFQAGFPFQDGDADLFGRAGIDGGFIDQGRTRLHVAPGRYGCADQGAKVGLVGFIHGGGYGQDDDIGLAQRDRILGVGGVDGLLHLRCAELERGILASLAGLHLVLGDIEANGWQLFAEFDDQGEADVAETDDSDADVLITIFHECVLLSFVVGFLLILIRT